MGADVRERPRALGPALAAAALVIAGAVPRMLLAADMLPPPLRAFTWSDVLFTWERGLAGQRVPYWDTPFEYPPLTGSAAGALSLLAPSALAYVAAWAVVQALAAAVVAASLASSGRAAWVWALAPELALLGPINFDLVPVAALVLAVRWENDRRSARATAAIALGATAKLFPAVALPAVLVRALVRRGPRGAASLLAVFAAILAFAYVPSIGAPFPAAEGVGRYAVGVRANFDSFWGLVDGALASAGVDGAGPIVAITLGGLAITYLAVVIPASLRARDATGPVALAVLTLLLWSRLYSPQFSLWALPFVALLPVPRRALALLVASDMAVFLTVYPLTLQEWGPDDPVRAVLFALLAGAVVLRHVALAAAWVAARRLSSATSP